MLYSKRLEQETPTRFWLNNPTPGEVKQALELGNCVNVASNANYVKRMLAEEETKAEAIALIDGLIAQGISDDHLIVALTAQHFLGKCAELFQPLFEETKGEYGWVAIQGNPFHDTDYDFMVEEAERFFSVAPNMRVKFPATVEAVNALETMTERGKATLATCGFSVSYAKAAVDAYDKGCKKYGAEVPTLYVTSLAGPFDEYMGKYIKANNVDVSAEVMAQAGISLSKKLYQLYEQDEKKAGYKLLSGCRFPYHSTELVPGDIHIVANFDFVEKLNDLDTPIEDRIHDLADDAVIAELCEKIPAFKYAYTEEGKYQHWSLNPGALYFRNYLRNGWFAALGTVKERRILSK